MDKLQPILKQKYWICFGFALIFVFTGWWLGGSAIGTEIEARKQVITAAFSTASQGADKPNQKWIEGAKSLNQKDKKAFDESSLKLWERQKAARIWHPEVQKEIEKIPYFGKIPQLSTRAKWASLYGRQFDELLKIVKPFEIKDGSGLVIVNPARITHRPYNSWVAKRPVSEEIWKNQEDIWLLKCLLTSIANVNADAQRITDASVREIVALQLRGGDPEAKPGATSSAGGFGGAGGPAFGAAGTGGGGAAGAASGMAGGNSGPWKSFEGVVGMDLLTEEFGSADGAAAGGGGGASEEGGMLGGGGGGFGAGGMTRSGFGGAGGGAAAEETDRYVHDAEGLPYKTRAFFLHVKIREERVAELLASLTDSDFPVQIVRVDLRTNAGSRTTGLGGGLGGGLAGGGVGGAPGMGGGGIGGAPGMGAGAGAGMAMGSGMDPRAGGGGGGIGGAPGMGGGGIGGAPGMESGEEGGMLGGGGLGPDGGNPYGGLGGAQENMTGQQARANAMADEFLIDLRVAGLMTLYQTVEEVVSQTETEAGAAQEAATSGGGTVPAPAEGTTTESGAAPPDGIAPATDGSTPATDTTPVEGAAPAEGTVPPTGTDSGTVPPTGSNPGTGATSGTEPGAVPPGAGEPSGTPETPADGSGTPTPAASGSGEPGGSP